MAAPRSVPLIGTRNDQAQKNRDIDGAMAFGGRRFIKQCTDQLSVGVSGERYFGEEGRLGWSVVWEDAVPSFGMTIGETKK